MVMFSFINILFTLALIVAFVYTSFIEENKGGFKRGEIKMKSTLSYIMKENSALTTTYSNRIENFANILLFNYFFGAYLYLGVTIFIVVVKQDNELFNRLITTIFEHGFEGIVLSLNAITITAIIFIATLSPKKYYLFFTKEDVIKNYKMEKLFLQISLTSVITIIIFLILGISEEIQLKRLLMGIYFIIIIFNLFLNIIALVRVWKVGFSSDKNEFKMLHSLNDVFGNNNGLLIIKQTDEAVLFQNLSFLLNDYRMLINKKKLSGILKCKKGIFSPFYDNELVIMKAKEKLSVIFIVLTGVLVGYIKDIGHCNCTVIISIVINIIMVLLINSNWRKEYIEQYTLNFVYPNFGYLFEWKDSEGSYEEYVGYNAMYIKNIFDKYIIKCKNIMAFYCIICNSMTVEQNTDLIKVDVVEKLYDEALLALDEELSEDEMWKDFMIKMPIIASSYFYFLKSKRIPDSISSYIVKFNEEKVKNMCSIIRAFITDISRCRTFDTNAKSVKRVYKNIKELGETIDATGFFEEIFKIANNNA